MNLTWRSLRDEPRHGVVVGRGQSALQSGNLERSIVFPFRILSQTPVLCSQAMNRDPHGQAVDQAQWACRLSREHITGLSQGSSPERRRSGRHKAETQAQVKLKMVVGADERWDPSDSCGLSLVLELPVRRQEQEVHRFTTHQPQTTPPTTKLSRKGYMEMASSTV